MDSQIYGETPSGDTQRDPLAPSPSVKSTVEQTEITNPPENQSTNNESPTTELKREFKLFEVLSLLFNGGLVIVGVWALCVYSGQLDVMRGTLKEMQRSGSDSTNQVWRAIDNINWLAKTMDGSLKQNRMATDAANRQSREALNASIQASRTDQRAWVSVTDVKTVFSVKNFTGGEAHVLNVPALLKNTGKTPALHVMLFALPIKRFLATGPIPDLDSEIAKQPKTSEEEARKFRNDFARRHPGGLALFGPQLTKPAERMLAPGQTEAVYLIEDFLATPTPTFGAFSPVKQELSCILFRITYRDVFDSKIVHVSQYCFMDSVRSDDFEMCPSGNLMN